MSSPTNQSYMCICGHDYKAHFNGNNLEDTSCFFRYNCECDKFEPKE